MEELLFYQYMEYHKSHSTSVAQRFFKMPFGAKALFAATIISGLGGLYFLAHDLSGWAALAVLVECSCSVWFEYYIEQFQITHSKMKAEQRFAEWYQLKEWLAETPFSSNDTIQEIKERAECYIKEQKTTHKAKLDQVEKWLQILAVPLVLSVTAKIINGQTDTVVIIATSLTAFIACGMVYGLIKIAMIAWDFPKVWKLKQMTVFSADLQGVLDLDNFSIPQAKS